MKLQFIVLITMVCSICISQNAVVAVSKMNVVCVCIDNQIEIAAPNVESKKLKVSIIEGQGELNKIEDGKYLLHPITVGYISLKIEAEDAISVKKITVKKIPNPTPLLKGNMGGIISIDDIRDAEKLSCEVNNFDYKVNCKITSYVIVFRENNKNYDTAEYNIDNNIFNQNVKAFLTHLSHGDKVIFKNINARCPCDNEDRQIGSMSFIIE